MNYKDLRVGMRVAVHRGVHSTAKRGSLTPMVLAEAEIVSLVRFTLRGAESGRGVLIEVAWVTGGEPGKTSHVSLNKMVGPWEPTHRGNDREIEKARLRVEARREVSQSHLELGETLTAQFEALGVQIDYSESRSGLSFLMDPKAAQAILVMLESAKEALSELSAGLKSLEQSGGHWDNHTWAALSRFESAEETLTGKKTS